MSKVTPNGYNEETRAILDAARIKAGTSRDATMRALTDYGIAHGTLRAIYYDQRLGTPEFTQELIKAVDVMLSGKTAEEQAKAKAKHLADELVQTRHDRKVLRMAVAAMCGVCMDGSPTCWDGSCPLRVVSPLPLGKAPSSSAVTFIGKAASDV